MNGWISLHRKIQDSWIWDFNNPKMTLAWLDLLMIVNHDPENLKIGDKIIQLERGQKLISIQKLADRWKVDRRTAKRWLENMGAHGMLSFYSTSKYTVVTIENYSFYQDHGTSDGTSDGTSERPQTIRINNNKKDDDVRAREDEQSLSTLLSDSDWEKLDARYDRLDELIDMVDDRVVDVSDVRKPVSYICRIADSKNWPRKRKGFFDWAKSI